MRLLWENAAISTVYYFVFFAAPLNDISPLTGGIVSTPTQLQSISSGDFATIFEYARTLEDIGSLEMLDIFFSTTFICAGDGEIRFQLSGDGGQTFTTIAGETFNNGPPVPLPTPISQELPIPLPPHDFFFGSGLWLPFIESGDNKLVIRCQTRANVGTVDTWIYDYNFDELIDSEISIVYRKKVLF